MRFRRSALLNCSCSWRRWLALCVLVLLAAWSCEIGLAGERGLPARDGIGNFGQISTNLYRGAQPDANALQSLKKLGVKTIVNLRLPEDCWKVEEGQARALGILYTNMPLRGMGRPTDNQINRILSLLETAPGPVFVHCQHGCDRTGTIIACYRIKHDNWSSDSALKEANHYGMSRFERGMRSYVGDFWKRTTAASDLAKASPNKPTTERRAELGTPGVVNE